MGQVGFKLAQVEPKLDSSWHLEAILPSSCLHGPSWPHLGGNLEAIWANLSRQRGFLGSKVSRIRVSLTECAGPVEDEVFEEEESEEVLGDPARPCHPDYVRGRRIETRRAFRRAVSSDLWLAQRQTKDGQERPMMVPR